MTHRISPRPAPSAAPSGKVISLADWKLARALRQAEENGRPEAGDPWPWAYTFGPPKR